MTKSCIIPFSIVFTLLSAPFAGASLTGGGESDKGTLSVEANPAIIFADNDESVMFTATLEDENGDPVSGKTVKFEVKNTSQSGGAYQFYTNAATNAQGKAFAFWPSSPNGASASDVGKYNVRATVTEDQDDYDPHQDTDDYEVTDNDILLTIRQNGASVDAVPAGETVQLHARLASGASGKSIAFKAEYYDADQQAWVTEGSPWPKNNDTGDESGEGSGEAIVDATLSVKKYRFTAESQGKSDSDKATGYKLEDITLEDSDNRTSEEGFLEVVPPLAGESITGTADYKPEVSSTAPNYPSWMYEGDEVGQGPEATLNADGITAPVKFLYSYPPDNRSVSADDESVVLKVYTNRVGSITLSTPDMDAIDDALDKWEDIQNKVGNPFFEGGAEPPTGSFAFSNQWIEKDSSNLVQYKWSLAASSNASIYGKAKLSTALAGIPPFLVEANAFVSATGEFGVDGTASVTSMGEFSTTGGANGSATLGIGGEASAVAGLLAVGIQGSSSLTASGDLYGTSTPPELGVNMKVEAGDLTVSYTVNYLWGAWEDTDSWQVWEPYTLYQDKVPIVPGPFSS